MTILLRSFSYLFLYLVISTVISCADKQPSAVLAESLSVQSLPDIWYAGKGEISVYNLEQNRYNAIHPGKLTTIFVTEPFRTDKQVKNDSGTLKNTSTVLKMNKIRRFTTGIYDYSTYSSVFTDVKKAKTLKVTTSIQDWCGQAFMQLNRDRDNYKVQVRSYFEKEGDQNGKVKATVSEDELPILLRIDPKLLPTGKFKILPSQEFARLKHIDLVPLDATGSLSPSEVPTGSIGLMKYTIEIPSLRRVLTYTYDGSDVSRPIVEWTDSYPSAFDGKIRTSTATLIKREWLPYWSLNNPNDSALRKDFELQKF